MIKLEPTRENIQIVAGIIKNAGSVIFPTETVYGLGVDIFNITAIEKVYQIKNRDYSKPLAAHISSLKMVEMVSDIIPDIFYELAHIFLPGPLSLIVPAKESLPSCVVSRTRSIAIRFPSEPVCIELINEVGSPIAATSANISGSIPVIDPKDISDELASMVDALIDNGATTIQQESTIISLVNKPFIIREGAISIETIEGKLGKKLSVNASDS